MFAVMSNAPDLVLKLLKAGADPDLRCTVRAPCRDGLLVTTLTSQPLMFGCRCDVD